MLSGQFHSVIIGLAFRGLALSYYFPKILIINGFFSFPQYVSVQSIMRFKAVNCLPYAKNKKKFPCLVNDRLRAPNESSSL